MYRNALDTITMVVGILFIANLWTSDLSLYEKMLLTFLTGIILVLLKRHEE